VNRNPEALVLLRRDREPDEPSGPAEAPKAPASDPGEVDAAESRWDPWLLALARIAAQEDAARPN